MLASVLYGRKQSFAVGNLLHPFFYDSRIVVIVALDLVRNNVGAKSNDQRIPMVG